MSSPNPNQPGVVYQPCRCRRGPGLWSMLFQAAAIYVVLVFAGGTLMNSSNPVAQEVGKLIHTVTFIEPAIAWAHANDFEAVATGMQTLAAGFPIQKYVS